MFNIYATTGCSTETGRLHEMDRRTMNYKSVIGEPLVTDYKIREGWYSLDQYRIVEGVGNLKAGSCGTRYQIVIEGNHSLSISLKEMSDEPTIWHMTL